MNVTKCTSNIRSCVWYPFFFSEFFSHKKIFFLLKSIANPNLIYPKSLRNIKDEYNKLQIL